MLRNYRIGNRSVHATITKPRDRIQSLRPAKHLIHVEHRYVVQAGDILYDNQRPRFLLANHHLNDVSRVFAGLELNAEIEIQATKSRNNAVSRMNDGREPDGPPKRVWACEDVITAAEVVGLKNPETIYYTNEILSTQHLVNGQRVRNVTRVAGIYRIEVHG